MPSRGVHPITRVVRIPMRFKRQGGRKRILAPDGSDLAPPTRAQPDGPLVKALARAWRWQRQLDAGMHASLAEIAAAEKLSPSYVSRIARLAQLAPDITEAILEGTLNKSVILARLEKGMPVEWAEQRACLDRELRSVAYATGGCFSERRSLFPLSCRPARRHAGASRKNLRPAAASTTAPVAFRLRLGPARRRTCFVRLGGSRPRARRHRRVSRE